MDLKWFLRYLTLTRWSKLLAVFLAFVFFGIIAFYFIFLQANYRQKEWHFKNSGFFKHSITLEPDRVYRISWEKGYKTFPDEVKINGVKSHPYNYLKMRYIGVKHKYVCYINMTNPFYVRLKDETDFQMNFMVRTPLDWGGGLGDFFSTWVESLADPAGIVNWSVVDVTDTIKYLGYLSVDGEFPVYKLRGR